MTNGHESDGSEDSADIEREMLEGWEASAQQLLSVMFNEPRATAAPPRSAPPRSRAAGAMGLVAAAIAQSDPSFAQTEVGSRWIPTNGCTLTT